MRSAPESALKIDALAKLGQLLEAMPKAKGAIAGGSKVGSRGSYRELRDDTPTYADLKLTKKTAMVAQQLAALPADVRQAVAARETGVESSLDKRHGVCVVNSVVE